MSLMKLLGRLRTLEGRRKEMLASLRLPTKGLPGSLAQSRRRCGSQGCHCHRGEPHLSWTLTFMVNGKKHTQHIPNQWVEQVQRRVNAGREFQDAVREVLAANAQLLVLARKQRLAQP